MLVPWSASIFGSLALIFLVLGAINARAENSTNAVTVANVRSHGKRIALNETVAVTVRNLGDWTKASGNDATRLVPFLNGLQIKGLYPEEVHLADNLVVFHLRILRSNQEVWNDFLRQPSADRLVAFSVGPEDQSPFETVYRGANKLVFTIIPASAGLASLAVILFVGVALVILARTTNILRDSGPAGGGGF
jgi:hypothetical protein